MEHLAWSVKLKHQRVKNEQNVQTRPSPLSIVHCISFSAARPKLNLDLNEPHPVTVYKERPWVLWAQTPEIWQWGQFCCCCALPWPARPTERTTPSSGWWMTCLRTSSMTPPSYPRKERAPSTLAWGCQWSTWTWTRQATSLPTYGWITSGLTTGWLGTQSSTGVSRRLGSPPACSGDQTSSPSTR